MKILKKLLTTGAISKASPALAREFGKYIASTQDDIPVFACEIGIGSGPLTAEIQQALPAQSEFFALDIDQVSLKKARQQFENIKIYEHDAQDLSTLLTKYYESKKLDLIASSLPFSNFPINLQTALLQSIHDSLHDDGIFCTYLYAGMDWMPQRKTFLNLMQQTFSSIERSPIIPNVPPARVYLCRK